MNIAGINDQKIGFCFILPTLVVICLVVFYPVIYTISISFLNWYALSKNHDFVGFRNYLAVLSDPLFAKSVINTIIYTFVGATAKILIGLGLALILNKRFIGRTIVRTFLIAPWVIPLVPFALTWVWMYDSMFGVINFLLQKMHIITSSLNFLGSAELALPSVLLVGIIVGYPTAMLMILAALQSIPESQYEAARVDGANAYQQFRYITLPGIRETMRVVTTLTVIWSFNSFDLVWLMTKGGPSGASHILSTYAFETAFIRMHYDRAAAICVFIQIFLASFFYFIIELIEEEKNS